jgi:hypothetical protein
MKTKQKYSKAEIGALADAFDKSLATIQRWIKSGNDILTSQKAINTLNQVRK